MLSTRGICSYSWSQSCSSINYVYPSAAQLLLLFRAGVNCLDSPPPQDLSPHFRLRVSKLWLTCWAVNNCISLRLDPTDTIILQSIIVAVVALCWCDLTVASLQRMLPQHAATTRNILARGKAQLLRSPLSLSLAPSLCLFLTVCVCAFEQSAKWRKCALSCCFFH